MRALFGFLKFHYHKNIRFPLRQPNQLFKKMKEYEFIWIVFFLRSHRQPLRLDIKRRLTSRSDRVKCVDLHPTEPWMLCALYNGHVHVMNYENQQLFKDFEVRVANANVKCPSIAGRIRFGSGQSTFY